MTQTPPALIETMRLDNGRIALWAGHRARLLASARTLGYPLNPPHIDDLVAEEIQRLAAPRTTQAPGPVPSSTADESTWSIRLLLHTDGQCTIQSNPLPITHEPVQLAWADHALPAQSDGQALNSQNPWLRHKTTHRPWFAAAQHWLQRQPAYFDLLFCNQDGDPCEGSRCNLYIRDLQGHWLTPPLTSGLLPGVQRQWLLDQGQVQEARLSRHDLETAPGLRVSNALRGWLEARLDSAGWIHSFT